MIATILVYSSLNFPELAFYLWYPIVGLVGRKTAQQVPASAYVLYFRDGWLHQLLIARNFVLNNLASKVLKALKDVRLLVYMELKEIDW